MVLMPEMQTVIDATYKAPRMVVRIGGYTVDASDVTVRHSVKDPIGTCTIELAAPIPEYVTLGAKVEVQMGYPQLTGIVFRGPIPHIKTAIDIQGRHATISAVSNGNRLNRKDYVDVTYAGAISLKDLFQAVCTRRKVESFFSDDTTYVDRDTGATNTIFYGNNIDANKKSVKVAKKTTSLSFLNSAGNILGYYTFDTPNGVRQKRVAGLPDATAAIAVTEAWNAFSITRDVDAGDLAPYVEVFGAKYTDADGATVALRSIPLSLPDNAILRELYGEGWARDERSSDLLDTIALCDAARNVAEMEQGAPTELVSWETHGAPLLMPGDVVDVTSPTTAAAGLQWVMSVEHRFGKDGFFTTCEGWRGNGAALPRGEDCITIPIPGGPWHVGDEYLPHYAVPSPSGLKIRIPFSVTQEYSSLTIRGWAHGCNSYLIDNKNTDSKVSRFEIRKQSTPDDDDDTSGSGDLPVLNEDLALQRPYGQMSGGVLTYAYWSRFVVPIPNGLEVGDYYLDMLSGKDNVGGQDDFEAALLTLTACGVGEPVMPTEVG